MDERICGAIELVPAEMRAGLAADLSAGDRRATELLKQILMRFRRMDGVRNISGGGNGAAA